MKIKNLFTAIAVSIAVVFGFTACINGGKGGFSQSLSSPAVIELNLATGLFLKTAYGTFVPDNASAAELMLRPNGSCIYMAFEYNSEFQTGQYYVASNIKYLPVDIDYIHQEDADIIKDYTFPLSSVDLFGESCSPFYNGKFFVETKAKLGTNQALEYFLYVKPGEQSDATGEVTDIYMQAHLPGTASGTQDIPTMRALDLRNMISSSGRDTTVSESGTNIAYKYLRVNLKYCSEYKDGAPVFKSATSQPFFVSIFKD